jgi:hypothetical protein
MLAASNVADKRSRRFLLLIMYCLASLQAAWSLAAYVAQT